MQTIKNTSTFHSHCMKLCLYSSLFWQPTSLLALPLCFSSSAACVAAVAGAKANKANLRILAILLIVPWFRITVSLFIFLYTSPGTRWCQTLVAAS